jgi:hypothetical protein
MSGARHEVVRQPVLMISPLSFDQCRERIVALTQTEFTTVRLGQADARISRRPVGRGVEIKRILNLRFERVDAGTRLVCRWKLHPMVFLILLSWFSAISVLALLVALSALVGWPLKTEAGQNIWPLGILCIVVLGLGALVVSGSYRMHRSDIAALLRLVESSTDAKRL